MLVYILAGLGGIRESHLPGYTRADGGWLGVPCQCHPESVPTCCHQSCIPVIQQAQNRPPNQLIQMRPKLVEQGGEVRASKEFKYYEPGHVQPLAT